MQKENAVSLMTDLLVIDGESLTHFAKGSTGTVKVLSNSYKMLRMEKTKVVLPGLAMDQIITRSDKKEGDSDG